MNSNITQFIENLKLNKEDILGIDGPCGSGKSTLALRIAEKYDVDVIHLDDFFLPRELRNEKRLSEIGGNVHYERFVEEVIKGIQNKSPFTYRKFSCKEMDYTDKITVNNNKPIVIEGSYCLRPDLRDVYTNKIYLEIDSITQKQRLIKRVGVEQFKQFETLWIPKETAYINTFNIKEIADLIL